MMDYSYAMPTDNHRSHTAVASGYLFKVSHEGTPFAQWHRRYYVLYSDGLLYSFKNARSKASNRVIPVGRMCLRMKFGGDTTLEDCNSWPKGVPQRLCFSIINSDRSYHFFCDSEREFETWRDHLLGTLDKLASHWSIDKSVSARVEVAVNDTTFHQNATPNPYTADPGDQAEKAQKNDKEADIQIEVESVEDELPYDKVGPANVGRHGGVASDQVESEGGEEHTQHRLALDSDSEGSLANESTAVNISEENLAALEPSGEEASEGEETNRESEQAVRENTSTTVADAERTTNMGVKGEGIDCNHSELTNHEEQLFIKSMQTVDPEVQEFLPIKAEELETEALSLHTQQNAVKPDALDLEFQKVEDMIELVFNEMTSPPASHSQGKHTLSEREQERFLTTTQMGERKSIKDMGLDRHALTSLSDQRAQVKEVMTRVGPASNFHGTSGQNGRVDTYSRLQPQPIKKEVCMEELTFFYYNSLKSLSFSLSLSHTHTKGFRHS